MHLICEAIKGKKAFVIYIYLAEQYFQHEGFL